MLVEFWLILVYYGLMRSIIWTSLIWSQWLVRYCPLWVSLNRVVIGCGSQEGVSRGGDEWIHFLFRGLGSPILTKSETKCHLNGAPIWGAKCISNFCMYHHLMRSITKSGLVVHEVLNALWKAPWGKESSWFVEAFDFPTFWSTWE